jgi:two-component system OmpR family response regulator
VRDYGSYATYDEPHGYTAVKLLVVEDDPRMAELLDRGLTRSGWAVTSVGTVASAQDETLAGYFDVIVCDVMLPDGSGLELCRWLRGEKLWVPLLLLTARSAVRDRVAGLDSGADDYLGKPFAFAELTARVRALARRGPVERPTTLSVGPFMLDTARQSVTVGAETLELSPREYALLSTFLRRPGQLLTRAEILDRVWDPAYDARSNVVDVYVRYLRRKLEAHHADHYLVTVRGRGYLLDIGSET